MKILVLILFCFYVCPAASSWCNSDEIRCSDGDECVRQYYICDDDPDCWDESDEQPELCYIWQGYDCSRGETRCTRNGDSFCVSIPTFCTMDDPPCEGDLDRRVCEMLNGGILADLSNFVGTIPNFSTNLNKSEQLGDLFKGLIPQTMSHEDCPPMYTLVGDQCLSLFFIGELGWAESREFCSFIRGKLATFPDVTHYAMVLQHLQENGIMSDFWIGGFMEDKAQGWTWIDGSPMQSGSPFWSTRYSSICVDRNVTSSDSNSVCYTYQQAPSEGANGQCVSLSFENFFYMTDSDCLEKKSPFCVYNGEKLI